MEYHIPDQFLSNILLVKKKDEGNRPCLISKALNKFIAYKHFKMEGLHCLKYFLKKNGFLGNKNLKRCLFLSVSVHELKKVCDSYLVRKSLRAFLPLFWIWACLKEIFKTINIRLVI